MTEEEQKELSEEDKKQLLEYLGIGEEKHNVHSFLNKVASSSDTTKTGNLTQEELGDPSKTLRTYKEMALIANKLMNNANLGYYYNQKAEIITSTSLSKNAKLVNLAVIQKRVVEDETKTRKENKGWFKKKNKDEETNNEL